MKSHYLHAHKIKDITSKTIRANARLFEKYKTDSLPEAGLLEILSQQVMQNLANQYAVNVPTIKQEVVTEKSTSVLKEDRGKGNISNAIKLENSSDREFHSSDVSSNSVKEEARDTGTSVEDTTKIQNDGRVTLKKPSTRPKKPKKPAVETVIVGDPPSTQLEDVVVKSEDRLFEYQISELEDGATSSDPTDSTTSPPSSSARTVTDPQVQKCNKNFHCDICPKSYSQKSKLKVHIKRVHTVDGISADKRKMCEICGKTYGENSALQKHIKFTHSNIRPFSCEICGRAFKDSNGLKVGIYYSAI